VVADERHAVAEWRMRGTFDGASFEGIEPTGRPVELRGVDLFEIEEGAVKASSVYYDGMAFARGAGMLPPPDSGTERAIKGAFNAITKVRRAVNERTGS
jgi:SnoaL-like polyketide cyclase